MLQTMNSVFCQLILHRALAQTATKNSLVGSRSVECSPTRGTPSWPCPFITALDVFCNSTQGIFTLQTEHCKLNTSHQTLNKKHCKLITSHWKLQTEQGKLQTEHFTMNTVQYTLHTKYKIVYISHFIYITPHKAQKHEISYTICTFVILALKMVTKTQGLQQVDIFNQTA